MPLHKYYSKVDEKALFYVAIIIVSIIIACLWFGVRYNNLQVDKRLAADGVTIYTRVSNVYKEDNPRGGLRYYAILDYVYKSNHLKQSFVIDDGYCDIGDTVILKRLIHNDSQTYMKIIGIRSNGVDLFRRD
jgi:hypothetical protein